MINKFCAKIGVSRSGNENLTSCKKLEFYAREELNANAPRTFAVLTPIELEIVNFDDVTERVVEACIFPPDKSKGVNALKITPSLFVDREDFSEEVKKGFFGIMPGQVVCLRYGPFVQMEEVVKGADGSVEKVKVRVVPMPEKKVKGVIQWVAKEHSIEAVVNQYSTLFTVENVIQEASNKNCNFTDFFNQQSLIKYEGARVWEHLSDVKEFDRFQFERVGYFCVDKTSKTPEVGGKLVFNGIVALKEAAAKRAN